MRTVDLDQMRPVIAEIKLNGKTFQVYERNLRQRLTHDLEFNEATKDLERIKKKNKGEITDEFMARRQRWLWREVQIYIPEFTEEDNQELTDTQRAALFQAIFDTGNEEPATEKKSPSKAKRRGGNSSE